jgi:hypothetical protein
MVASPGPAAYPVAMTILDVAKRLAAAHQTEDPTTSDVFLAESEDEVRLVEVSKSVGTTGQVLPFRFGPRADQNIPYPSVVVVLSPAEWELVRKGELKLPDGWGDAISLKKIA